MPDALPWRLGACLDDTAPDHTPAPDPDDAGSAGLDLDALAPPAERPAHSIPHLRSLKRPGGDLDSLNRVIEAMPASDTQTLITRIGTTDDPLKLWALHCELDRRDIEPCLRWPGNTSTAQMRYITVMADLFWFVTRYPDHEPSFKNWQRLFKETPGSEAWLDRAFYLCRFSLQQDNLSRCGSKALALSPAHRQQMMMFPTSTMANRQRHQLEQDRFAEAVTTIYSAAQANKFKPRACNTEVLAHRRARLWRVFVLLNSSPEATAKAWSRLTGEAWSRQSVSKQIAIVKTALKKPRVSR